jgi:hypothetical protein
VSAFDRIGVAMADRFFARRSKGKRVRQVEVHISEAELAALLAVAAEAGSQATRETQKVLPCA